MWDFYGSKSRTEALKEVPSLTKRRTKDGNKNYGCLTKGKAYHLLLIRGALPWMRIYTSRMLKHIALRDREKSFEFGPAPILVSLSFSARAFPRFNFRFLRYTPPSFCWNWDHKLSLFNWCYAKGRDRDRERRWEGKAITIFAFCSINKQLFISSVGFGRGEREKEESSRQLGKGATGKKVC